VPRKDLGQTPNSVRLYLFPLPNSVSVPNEEEQMKATVMVFAMSAAILLATSLSADTLQDRLNGTWSGTWIPSGGVRDAMTIEIKHDDTGKLTGRFVSPVSMNFEKAVFDTRTHSLLLEGTDAASGKQYKVTAKVEGTEIKGTVTAGNETGSMDLIKWTYVPGINRY
jgi:hypothetical protein